MITRLLAVLVCASMATACATPTDNRSKLSALPNIIAYKDWDYAFGPEDDWPGGEPTNCDDLGSENVTKLKQVGVLTHITSDETASLGEVGSSGSSVKVFAALRSPPKDTVVIVAEPYAGCFVIYSPMA